MVKNNSFVSVGLRVLKGVEWCMKRLDRLGVYIAAVLTITLIGSSLLGRAEGQAGSTIDVANSYAETAGTTYSITGDQGSNIQALFANDTMGKALEGTAYLVGTDAAFGAEAAVRAQEVGLSRMAQSGLLGTVDSEVMALVSNPPGVDLPQHLAKQWVPGYEDSVSTVYAEDGYTYLSQTVQIEPLWEMMRNFSYALFVIIIMVAGFMIMFRSKIGGQMTVSIMNAIPGIIIGLVMVTFSFAIVGFIMDIGRLISMMLSNYMSNTLGISTIQLGSPFEMAFDAFKGSASVSPGWSSGSIFSGGGFMSLLFKGGMAIAGIVGILVVLILAAVAFYAAIRVYVTLVMSYIKILMELIFSPLYIVMGALPGRSASIVDWLKRVASHVLVFPVVFFLLNLGAYIGQSSMDTGFNQAIHFLSGGSGISTFIQLRGLFVIAIYFLAAGAPGIVQELVGAAESKGVMGAVDNAKRAAGKIPLVGGLFG